MDPTNILYAHKHDYLWLAGTLIATGTVLVIVNLLVHSAKEAISEQTANKSRVRNNLKSVLRSSEQLIRSPINLLLKTVVLSAITSIITSPDFWGHD